MTIYRIGCVIAVMVLLVGCSKTGPDEILRVSSVTQVEFTPNMWSGTERVVLTTNQAIVIHQLVKELNSNKTLEFQATAKFITFGHFIVDGEKYVWNGSNLIKTDGKGTHRMIGSHELKSVDQRLKVVLNQNHSSELTPTDWKVIFRAIAR